MKKLFPLLFILSFVPFFSNSQVLYEDYKPADKRHIILEQFKDNNRKWVTNNKWLDGEINPGNFSIACRNYNNNNGLSYLPINFDDTRDYEIEVNLKNTKGDGGIIWGMANNYSHYRVELQKNKWLIILDNNTQKQTCKKLFKADVSKLVKPNETNKLTIRKFKNTYFFYINGEAAGTAKDLILYGNNYGFSVGVNSKVDIQDFTLSYLDPLMQISDTEGNKSFPNLIVEDIVFFDENENNTIEAFEKCNLSFNIRNIGTGTAENIVASIYNSNSLNGLIIPDNMYPGNIEPNQHIKVTVPITAEKDLKTGTLDLNIQFDETNGFPPDALALQIAAQGYSAPSIKVVDYKFASTANTLKLGVPLKLKVLVQNVGKGAGQDIKIYFDCPSENIMALSDQQMMVGNLSSGEAKELIFEFIANKRYDKKNIPITVKLSEKTGENAEGLVAEALVNQAGNNQALVISTMDGSSPNAIAGVAIQTLVPDIDENIPVTRDKKQNRYALIIGNEDYSSYQTGLSAEINVDYAINDAEVFAQYANKTMGIPQEQIKVLKNATASQMKQGLAWIKNLAKIEGGNAEIVFYYSGHGLPDENTKEPYLIPVDVSAVHISQAIKMDDVLTELSEYPSEKITLFVDACFSGGARNKELLAMKGFRIKPTESKISGNIVMFSSSSGAESSGVYREKKHGFFTYYLLKKLQETEGKVNYGEWAEYTKHNVAKKTGLISKPQTPQVKVSSKIQNEWANWTVK